ncbi:hypothetical protein IJG93_00240 [Candidatus Saccharibacteria bacterium]|nr:hypothetical protein [Candidatus Saccharibacteria bacterium]
MYFLKILIGFYNSAEYNWLILLLLSWLIWPGMMLLVGIIFESRLVPVWKHQAKAFLPGDLAFGVIFVSLVSMYAKSGLDFPMYNIWFGWLVLTVLDLAVFLPIRKIDVANYPPRARRSPTKMVHDLIGYFFIPILLAYFGLMQVLIQSSFIKRLFLMEWLCIGAGGLFYLACLIADLTAGCTAEDVELRHPEDWKPIWISKNR